MKATERQALLRVAAGRFDLLERAVEQTRDELKIKVRERLHEEAKARRIEAEAGMAEIIADARAVEQRAREHIGRCERELGVTTGHYRRQTYVFGSGKNKREETRVDTWRESSPITLQIKNDWTVLDIQKQMDAALAELEKEAGLGRYNVAKMRVEFEEKVLLGDVTSDEAKALLAGLPSVDELPDPAELIGRLELARVAATRED